MGWTNNLSLSRMSMAVSNMKYMINGMKGSLLSRRGNKWGESTLSYTPKPVNGNGHKSMCL